MKVEENEERVTAQTRFSVRKIVDGFSGFGFQDEGRMVEHFLKGIGLYEESIADYVFTPANVASYLNTMRMEEDQMSDVYMWQLIRGLQEGNYSDISKGSMAQFLADHKIYMSRQEIETFMRVIED